MNSSFESESLVFACLEEFTDSTFKGGRSEGSDRVAISLKILQSNFTTLESLVFKLFCSIYFCNTYNILDVVIKIRNIVNDFMSAQA